MKKHQILIGFLLVASALYFGLKGINFEIKNELSSQSIQEELLQEKFQAYQDFGYYNGLVMPARVLGENEWFKKMGWEYDTDLTCQKVVDEMYKMGQEHATRPK